YGDDIGGLGMFFDARLRAIVKDGSVQAEAGGLSIRGASEVTLVLAAATSFNGSGKSPSRQGADAAVRSRADLSRAAGKSFAALRDAHVADYSHLFGRVKLQ